jgi:hypothetical protein
VTDRAVQVHQKAGHRAPVEGCLERTREGARQIKRSVIASSVASESPLRGLPVKQRSVPLRDPGAAMFAGEQELHG